MNLDPDGYYRNIDNYDVTWHKKMFLGSAGRNAGMSFGNLELEDFQTIIPKFSGKIKYSGKEGNYTDTVIIKDKLNYDDVYTSDPYGFYMNGIERKETIINENNPDGMKVLFIRDSFASPMIIDMIPYCSEIHSYWGKFATDETVKNEIDNGNYDLVIVGYYTEDLIPNFFHFYENDVPEAK